MSMSKKHFQLDCTIYSCHAIFYLRANWKMYLEMFWWPNITLFWKTTSSTNHSYSDTSQNVVQVSKEYPPWSPEALNELLGKTVNRLQRHLELALVPAPFSCRFLSQPTIWLCTMRGIMEASCNRQASLPFRHLHMIVSQVHHT